MFNLSSGKDNVVRLKKILKIAAERPPTDDSRSQATNSVYDHLRSFLKVSETKAGFSELVTQTVTDWNSLFNKSKQSYVHETLTC